MVQKQDPQELHWWSSGLRLHASKARSACLIVWEKKIHDNLKTRTIYVSSTRDPFPIKRHIQSESERKENGILYKQKSKESWSSSIHIRQNRLKTGTRENEGQYIMINGSIQEKDITIVNTYTPHLGAPQYIKQMLKL